MKVNLRGFDYLAVGTLDAEMWRAYYNHQFFLLFRQLLRLLKKQLGLGWIDTVRLAYYSAWAAADYRINRKNVKRARVLKSLTKFYRLISDRATEPFDYRKAAELELGWWNIHRQSAENNKALEHALAIAAAEIYRIDPALLRDYAHYRAEAMILPRHVSDADRGESDWQAIKAMTVKSWAALHSAVNQDSLPKS